jgi:hypothetical protein
VLDYGLEDSYHMTVVSVYTQHSQHTQHNTQHNTMHNTTHTTHKQHNTPYAPTLLFSFLLSALNPFFFKHKYVSELTMAGTSADVIIPSFKYVIFNFLFYICYFLFFSFYLRTFFYNYFSFFLINPFLTFY